MTLFNSKVGDKGGLYIFRGYTSESEFNNESGVQIHYLRCSNPSRLLLELEQIGRK